MTTPEEARELARLLRKELFWSDEAARAAMALEDLAKQLEEIWGRRAS